MKKPTRNHKLVMPSRRRLLGLSLIELMVALVLGIIIVAALSQLFVGISRTNQEMARTNSQIESARFAMQFLQDDIVHAGFWDTYVPEFDDLSLVDKPDWPDGTATPPRPAAIPVACMAYAQWDDTSDPNYSISYRDELVGVPLEVTASAPGICGALGVVADQLADTDVLVVRHAEICEPGVGNCDDQGDGSGGPDPDQLYFQASLCNSDPAPYLLARGSELLLQDKECATDAPARRFVQSIYYVRSWANVAGDGIPTLVRSQFGLDTDNNPPLKQQPAVALVEGIERFRVELGIDSVTEPYTGFPDGRPLNEGPTPSLDLEVAINWENEDNWETPTNRGDGIPDGPFVHCPTSGGCSPFQLLNVVAAKIYILARASEPTPGYTDTKRYELGESGTFGPFTGADADYKRHVFSTTIRLNNISGRRETP